MFPSGRQSAGAGLSTEPAAGRPWPPLAVEGYRLATVSLKPLRSSWEPPLIVTAPQPSGDLRLLALRATRELGDCTGNRAGGPAR